MKQMPRLPAFCLIVVMMVCASSASAMFGRAPEVPVERLLKNVSAYVKDNPREPQGYYLLGRINALAFDRNARKLRALEKPRRGKGKLPYLDPWQGRAKPGEKALTAEQLQKHLTDAVSNYHKAIELMGFQGLYHLGLACVLESGAAYAVRIGAPPGEKTSAVKPTGEEMKKLQDLVTKLGHKDHKVREAASGTLEGLMPQAAGVLLKNVEHKNLEVKSRIAELLTGYWRQKAIKHYLRAYEAAIKTDLKIKSRPLRGLSSLVSYEAGRAWIRMIKQRGVKKSETKTLAQVEKDIKTIVDKPSGWVTPIVFTLRSHGGLRDLLAEGAAVPFNLDGTGRTQQWQWVRPTTAILVWDPAGRGRITSGRQLFGTVTWWMFWPDGYRAMDALDDDRDGWLSGAELAGLAAWFDRNTNVVSDPGEVVKLGSLGVTGLATRAAGKTRGAPFNPAGLKLRTGRVLPTYDWLASPAQEPK